MAGNIPGGDFSGGNFPRTLNIESNKTFKILKNFDETKIPGVDDLSEIFLKDDVPLLTTLITQL